MKNNLLIIIVLGFFSISILAIIWLINAISPLPLLATNRVVLGKVYDCTTGRSIENAQVSVTGRSWGFSNSQLVWDKDHNKTDKSNSSGQYSVEYNIGSDITVSKEGYLQAYDFVGDKKEIDIGLMNQNNTINKTDRTFHCKLDSECYKKEIKDGVEHFWNSCTNPDFKP